MFLCLKYILVLNICDTVSTNQSTIFSQFNLQPKHTFSACPISCCSVIVQYCGIICFRFTCTVLKRENEVWVVAVQTIRWFLQVQTDNSCSKQVVKWTRHNANSQNYHPYYKKDFEDFFILMHVSYFFNQEPPLSWFFLAVGQLGSGTEQPNLEAADSDCS